MPPIFCFIDDSQFELDVFASCIAPAAQDLEFILGNTYDEVRRKLGHRHPCLFLLDLYGLDPDLTAPRIPTLDELTAEAASFKSLADVYDGLDDYPGDRLNEYLKRFFHVTDSWRRLFYRVSRLAGQNIKFGLNNLEAVRRDYPPAAAIGYTRKSIIIDAVDILYEGADGLNLKPDGPNDDAIRQATVEAAPDLIDTWSILVTKRFSNHLRDLAVLLVRSNSAEDVSNLTKPESLSQNAKDVLGPGDILFLETAAQWWEYIGREPI